MHLKPLAPYIFESVCVVEMLMYNSEHPAKSCENLNFDIIFFLFAILQVSGNAIKRLQSARLYPIAIFLKPSDPTFIMSINDRMTEEQADKAFNRALRLEHDFINYFTGIIKGDTFDDVYDKVKTVIKTHSKNTIWVPANEMF